MRGSLGSVLVLALVSLAAARAPAQDPPPRTYPVGEGLVGVEMRGRPPSSGDYQGGRRVTTWFDDVTMSLIHGAPAELPPRAPFRSSHGSLRETDTRVCGVAARRRELIEDPGELTAWVEDDDGSGIHEEVTRYPLTFTASVTFEWNGEHWLLEWVVRDARHRGRYRAHERRFFASVRCDAPYDPLVDLPH